MPVAPHAAVIPGKYYHKGKVRAFPSSPQAGCRYSLISGNVSLYGVYQSPKLQRLRYSRLYSE